ncbi:MAG: glutamine--fructose-6-phosphate transaminase (isomerizing) [Candidatus Pacebacteria bacterium]|nr:glutamine--fructose-6-phosphate transaminase (isomerizing) [Candidatus Paceibacterota bacterium]
MCGIFGYIGFRKATPLLIEGLRQMEYRGYDSAGVCLSEKNGLKAVKAKGRVGELVKKAANQDLASTIGIAHTRWATHGAPSEKNAHPHLDCQGDIAVVHNGIIENYQALKKILEKEGHCFVSETDSEVISHLIEKFSEGASFEGAVLKTLKILQGTFGLAVVKAGEDKIIGARKGSPFILGLGDGEMFLASDASAILKYTKKVVYLDDGEMVTIGKDGFLTRKLNGEVSEKEVCELKWNAEQIEKGGFKHFMLKEIFEQPQAVANTLRGRLASDTVKLSVDIDAKAVNRIVIMACGTSFYSGLIGKQLIEKFCRVRVDVEYASEFRYRDPIVDKDDLAVVISQSGETADTLAALKEAKERGAKTLGIVNVVGSTIAREVDCGIYLHAGPEISVAATKAFTCQIAALALLTAFLQEQRTGRADPEFLRELAGLPEKIQDILDHPQEISKIAEVFRKTRNALYLGRGFNYPLALEGALKLKETSYIHAEGYPAAEMKHGPIALIDENMPAVFIATKDQTYEKILSNMQEIKARGGRILAIVNPRDKEASNLADWIIETPVVMECLSPMVNVVPLQLLAYYVADAKGIDVDKPRNLAKSVTVE